MSNVSPAEKLSGVTISNLSKVIREQGFSSLWRGNNVNMYRQLMLIGLNVTVYDKIKNAYMPLDQSRYSGIDYYWRFLGAASMTCSLTAAVAYPLDLIHTRISSDITKKGGQRLFTTTFDCFNRTNIDEGRKGLYKGVEVSMASSAARCLMTLPVLDLVKSNSKLIEGENKMVKEFNQKLGIALLSSLVMSTLLYPLDTVKRNLQLNGARGHYTLYSGSLDCIK